ncbi:MAG: hypothetical protein IMF17_06865 [Proteobacteria bacterium]|nr:hypothetical protein [Pseudomonadota bacterium]
MATLIIHLGPGKCGSSTIQQFFATHQKPCVQKTLYKPLNHLDIDALNVEQPDAAILATFTQQLSSDLPACDALILSHEYLFQSPYAIKNLCVLAKKLATKIFIIGYSRRQSEFLVSAYSQWLFRAPKRINEATDTVKELELEPVLFTGLERQVIASIANDFHSARQLSGRSILDWYKSYDKISQLTGDSATIRCGTLPKKESDNPLIYDFCTKSELTLDYKTKDALQLTSNVSYDKGVIEAVNIAAGRGFNVPGPHEGNWILELLSSNIAPVSKDPSKFLSKLKSYVDSYYLESNTKLCQRYKLSEEYFAPATRYSKSEIKDVIFDEAKQRSLNKSEIIGEYQMLSAKMVELCLKMAASKTKG